MPKMNIDLTTIITILNQFDKKKTTMSQVPVQ